ncbi:MAG: mycothione reductase [Ilumatobacteraceae bacterium]
MTDNQSAGSTVLDFDLVILGTGSGNSLISHEMRDWRIAIVERGVFGGTCLNRGCIPSKMLIYTADVASTIKHSAKYGVHGTFDRADWPAIRDRVFGRIDPIAEGGRAYRHSNDNVTVFEGDAHFVGERTLEIGGQRIRGTQVVIAAGARSFIPEIPGLVDGPYQTSDTVMRLDRLPEHLIVLGGGFIAAELGYVFSSLGSRVTIINRSKRLLMAEDAEISQRYTEVAHDLFDEVLLGTAVHRVVHGEGGVSVEVSNDAGSRTIEGDVLLVATGRRANGDQLNGAAAGIRVNGDGHVVVDHFGQTSAPQVWALGDVNGRHQLKHMANGEAKVVHHNLLNPDDLRVLDTRPAPHAVFTSPQIGAVGLTEQQARMSGRPISVITHEYAGAAYGWALEDTTSFAKLIGDPVTRKLVGVHILGYQASMLTQQLVQGMHLGNTVDELATGQIWIHPALNEVVEQALLALIEEFDRFSPASHPSA